MTGPAMKVGTVHHVSFRVDDLRAALEFYQGLLGCERIDRPDDDLPGGPGAWLVAGDTQVHLTESPADASTGSPPGAPTGIANHVAFHVDDLDATEAILAAHGCVVTRGAALPQLFVQDPTGNLIELTTH